MALSRARILPVLALIAFGCTVWEGWQIVQTLHWNAAIRAGQTSWSTPHVPPAVQFAGAYARAARGDIEGSLDAYRALHDSHDTLLRRAALFNSANLYLQQSLAAASHTQDTSALTLMELAKQSYRELLKDDSEDWAARYNLELALRAAPDPEDETADFPPPPDHRKTPSNASGTSLGLP